jgi:hypothetical protein
MMRGHQVAVLCRFYCIVAVGCRTPAVHIQNAAFTPWTSLEYLPDRPEPVATRLFTSGEHGSTLDPVSTMAIEDLIGS